jgi:hypothetical protein
MNRTKTERHCFNNSNVALRSAVQKSTECVLRTRDVFTSCRTSNFKTPEYWASEAGRTYVTYLTENVALGLYCEVFRTSNGTLSAQMQL